LGDHPAPVTVPRDYDKTRDLGDVLTLLEKQVADYRAVVRRVREPDLTAEI